MQLPVAFCWTKIGTEAGETIDDIMQRKEEERDKGAGVFFWGIGNSIVPSLTGLLDRTSAPDVVFTPILSKPRAVDVAPTGVVTWRAGVGLDGAPFEIPSHAHVTSAAPRGRRRCHYALVCHRAASLLCSANGTLHSATLRNLRTGAPVGSSQVTSVVERSSSEFGAGPEYEIAFTATLIYPYLVRLSSATGDRS